VVDDFLVKSCCQAGLDHLYATLRQHYTITVDEKASRFCGITLDWDYTPGKKHATSPCQVTLKRPSSDSPIPNLPSISLPPANGLPLNNMEPRYNNMLPLMTAPSHPWTQKESPSSSKLWEPSSSMRQAVDLTMHVALGTIAAAQTKGTAHIMDAAIHLLNYAASNPDAAIQFHQSDMILYGHS
jgi:hypothetical protein